MSLTDTTLTGDAVMHDAPAVSDAGPVIGAGLVLFAWVANWGVTLEQLDALAQFVTHSCFSIVAMVGAYKALSPGATKLWHALRRRPH